MFENFTDQAIKVILLAQEESRRMAQPVVGTEQLLLGLMREASNLGAQVLQDLGLSVEGLREVIGTLTPQTSSYRDWETDRKSTRLNSSHSRASRMPSSA